MRRPFVAGNWKMNGFRNDARDLVAAILGGMGQIANAEVVICPPLIYLTEIKAQLSGSPVGLGAQNCCTEKMGAFTGEVSATMLTDVGCRYVIVGHSERRALYGEEDTVVAKKFAIACASGLIPIVCVGERLEDREAGLTEAVVARQLDAVMNVQGVVTLGEGIIAYEPVWAIGTGRTASPRQAQEVHAFIRARVRSRDPETAEKIRILYGGSVKSSNAAELFAMPDIDGGLIGGASLNAREFLAICAAA
ncbi:triose-phosphate isomerase [Gammaproteobacteria bacterium]